MAKKESYLTELEKKEKLKKNRDFKLIQSHKCYNCYKYGRWTGTKFTCMIPRCVKDVNKK